MEERKKRGRKPKPPEEKRVGVTVRLAPTVKQGLHRAAYWLRKDVSKLVEPVIAARLSELERENGGPFEPVPDEAP
jgi:hypothetical protein